MNNATYENDLYEYLLVAHPNSALNEILMKIKKHFSGNYNSPVAVKTHPHITVANFMAREVMEPTIARWIQHIIGAQYSFYVCLNRFTGFPHHTIYLQVENPAPFQQLAKQLHSVNEYIRSSACPPVKFITRPQLTIARRLTENVYKEAMDELSQHTFQESFMVEELVLLRRLHQFDSCKTIQVFSLRPVDNFLYSDATRLQYISNTKRKT